MDINFIDCVWQRFEYVVEEIPEDVFGVSNNETVESCMHLCDKLVNKSCHSFRYCPAWKGGTCFWSKKVLYGMEEPDAKRMAAKKPDSCYSNYRSCDKGCTYYIISIFMCILLFLYITSIKQHIFLILAN